VRVDLADGPAEVLVIGGRVHLYEGHSPAAVVHLVRAAVLAGCERVVLTNAAGSLRPEVRPGTPVLISDHLNLMGASPMVGAAPPQVLGSRFVDLGDLYERTMRASLRDRRPDLVEGVYAGLLGGSFETPAEIRMLRTLGADLVGMSTVLEAIAAHHLGAGVVGLSLVTNLAAGLQPHVDHQEVLDVGSASVDRLLDLLRDVVEVL
jgi:purine-nucleoside phosphorylase